MIHIFCKIYPPGSQEDHLPKLMGTRTSLFVSHKNHEELNFHDKSEGEASFLEYEETIKYLLEIT